MTINTQNRNPGEVLNDLLDVATGEETPTLQVNIGIQNMVALIVGIFIVLLLALLLNTYFAQRVLA